MSIRSICFGMLLGLSGIFIFGSADAQGQHPYCLKALTDLKEARTTLLQHIDGQAMTHNEKEALRQINVVIRDINEAAIGNGNDPDNHPKTAEGQNDASSLQQCIKFLKKAKADLSHEEDGQFGNGLRDRSISNCDGALRFAGQIKGVPKAD